MNDMFSPDSPVASDSETSTDRSNVSAPATVGKDSTEFDWRRDSDAIVCQKQPRTAIYRGGLDQVVIRQERGWDEDEDRILLFNLEIVPTLLRSLARELDDNCWHAINDILIGMGWS